MRKAEFKLIFKLPDAAETEHHLEEEVARIGRRLQRLVMCDEELSKISAAELSGFLHRDYTTH